jgi:hypothetical protein
VTKVFGAELPEWQFLQVSDGAKENEQTQEEFFSNADVVSEVSGLVREAVQNSLDEVLDPQKPVRMVFSVRRQDPSVAARYFAPLYPHLEETALPELPDLRQQSKFLVIEDFNTLGLEGSTYSTAPSQAELAEGRPYKNSYWFFEWKSGSSNKKSGNRGSWGVGKIVFPRASGIKSYLVLSNRRPSAAPEGNPSILFGHSILKYRTVGDKRYVPDCQWMIAKKRGPIPSSNETQIKSFRDEWQLSRSGDELGTSIVVPFIREGLEASELVECIIRDYFVSILSGVLECVVKDEHGSSVEITSHSIRPLIQSLSDDYDAPGARGRIELNDLCDMFQAYLSGDVVRFSIPVDEKAPNQWKQIEIPAESAESAVREFNAGKVLEVRVDVRIPRRKKPDLAATADTFTVLLRKTTDLRSATVFCREGILIPAANPSSNLQNCVSLVFVGSTSNSGAIENSIANLLKNAEGPSHESWSKNASSFKGRYAPNDLAEKAITWVKQSALRSLRLILGQNEEEDDTYLGKYFPIKDLGRKSGDVQIKLNGQRDPDDENRGVLTWSIKGLQFDLASLSQLTPNSTTIAEGLQDTGSFVVDLDPSTATHKYQMHVRAGDKLYPSNVVTFRPLGGERSVSKVLISQAEGGFTISNKPGRNALVRGDVFTIQVEYRKRKSKGDSWDPEDFLLGDLYIAKETSGLEVLESRDNFAKFRVSDPSFFARWFGFDHLRDLKIGAS